MKHSNKNRTLGRVRKQRTALLRGLAESLIVHEKIATTEAKAKELRPFIERVVTAAKENTVASHRYVASSLGVLRGNTSKKLFGTIGPRYNDRNGGYTRVVKTGRTKSGRDGAVIEFV